jgi:hypothetical protein
MARKLLKFVVVLAVIALAYKVVSGSPEETAEPVDRID